MGLSIRPHSGLFICFEGGEGTGKTTQIRRLEENLKKNFRREVKVTWEPGGTALGEKVRGILLDPQNSAMTARCEALLYAAARAQHVETVILPVLNQGGIVLCDRYWDASRAYQGIGRSLGLKSIDEINHWATQGLRADFTFVFDLDATKGLGRAQARGQLDRLEQEGLPFHEKVRLAYLNFAHQEPDSYLQVDASLGVDDIAEILWKKVQNLLTP